MFRTVFPSIIRSSRLHIHTATVICQTDTVVCLLASRQQYLFDIYLLLYVRAVLNSWWWTERPSETCRVFFFK